MKKEQIIQANETAVKSIIYRTKDKKSQMFSAAFLLAKSVEDAQQQFIKNMLFGKYSSDILLFQVGTEETVLKMSDKNVELLASGQVVDSNSLPTITTFTELLDNPLDITPYSDVDYITAMYQKYQTIFNEVQNEKS